MEKIHGKETGSQLVTIESDMKVVKGDVSTIKTETKELKETVTHLSQQLNKAMDTMSNQLERLNSSRDDQECDMVIHNKYMLWITCYIIATGFTQ